MKKRLILLTLSTLISGFLYIPFIKASNDRITSIIWLLFPIGSTLGVLLFSWLGLRFADKSTLQMPILNKWESGQKIKTNDFRILLKPMFFSISFALITYAFNQYFSVPKNPGTLIERTLTTPWAAIVTETISHLFVMTGILLLIKNRCLSILLSSLIFLMLFHLNHIEGNQILTIYLGIMNFSAATLTGWIYSKYSFESAVVSHATMHIILLGLN